MGESRGARAKGQIRRERTFVVRDLPNAGDRMDAAAQSVLDRIESGKVPLPMLPVAAQRALALAGDPDAPTRELSEAVSREPLATARLIKIANSPVYGGVKQVTSVSAAVARLGTRALRDLLYQVVAEAHVFRGSDARLVERERAHGLTTGFAAKSICTRLGIDREYAFLCGLVHDIGRVVALGLLRSSRDEPLHAFERNLLLDRLHPDVGARLAEAWNLPPLAREAIHRHHVYRDWEQPGDYSQMGHVVAVADRVAHHCAEDQKAGDDPRAEAAAYELGLSPEDVEQIVRDSQALAQASG
jgi:putative nucleotidyltransferase with HDIG domain